MTDHYAVVGNPIAHSKSPLIHRLFAEQCNQDMQYRAELGDMTQFEDQVSAWLGSAFLGMNVTLPFKHRALALAHQSTHRAQLAGAANTLRYNQANKKIEADNTDGIGLMRDLHQRLGIEILGRRILVLGAGGATRGILGPLLEANPESLVVTNRTEERGVALVQEMQVVMNSETLVFNSQAELVRQKRIFDLVINATSSSLSNEVPLIPDTVWNKDTMAYDLAYVPSGETSFLALARGQGVTQSADGLGMLVEQAAEAFYWWRGIAPQTDTVLTALRKTLDVL